VIILADEPTGNLDSRTGREIMDIFHGLHEAGATILMVTHDASLADEGDRVVRLKDGILDDEG
jgi:putative ABC transport system ATP-binding protein